MKRAGKAKDKPKAIDLSELGLPPLPADHTTDEFWACWVAAAIILRIKNGMKPDDAKQDAVLALLKENPPKDDSFDRFLQRFRVMAGPRPPVDDGPLKLTERHAITPHLERVLGRALSDQELLDCTLYN